MTWGILVSVALVMGAVGAYWHAKEITWLNKRVKKLEERTSRLEKYVLRLRQVCKPYGVDEALDEIIEELERMQ